MATFFFQDEISKETVTKLIADIEASEDQNADVYFSSIGGDTSMAAVLVHYFTFCVKDIKLTFHWQIASAAIDVMLYSVCEKELLSDAWGVFHLYSRDIGTRDMLDKESCDKFLEARIAQENSMLIKTFSNFFTRSEIRRVKKGGNVYIDHDRFVKLFEEYAVKMEIKEEEKNGEEV